MSTPRAFDSLDRLVFRAREQVDVARPVIAPLFASPRGEASDLREIDREVMASPVRHGERQAQRAQSLSSTPAADQPRAEFPTDREPGERHERIELPAQASPGNPVVAIQPPAPEPRTTSDERTAGQRAATSHEEARVEARDAVGDATPRTAVRVESSIQRDAALLQELFQKLDASRTASSDAPVVTTPNRARTPTQPPQRGHTSVSPPSVEESDTAPIVRVTIGQVVVRAVTPAAAPQPAARSTRPGPSLEDYLARGTRR